MVRRNATLSFCTATLQNPLHRRRRELSYPIPASTASPKLALTMKREISVCMLLLLSVVDSTYWDRPYIAPKKFSARAPPATLDQETWPQEMMNNTVFEVHPINRLRLDNIPVNATTHKAKPSVFTDSIPNDHAPEVLLAHDQRANAILVPEQVPDLTSAIVMIVDPQFNATTFTLAGASATSWSNGRSFINSGSSDSFIHQRTFTQVVPTSTVDASYIRSTATRSYNSFGSQ